MCTSKLAANFMIQMVCVQVNSGYHLVYQFGVILDPQHVMLPVKIPQGVLMQWLVISMAVVMMKIWMVLLHEYLTQRRCISVLMVEDVEVVMVSHTKS